MKNLKVLSFLLAILLSVNIAAMAETYIVTATKANVRSKATTSSKIIGSLQKGIEINILDTQNGFARFDFMGQDGFTSLKLLKKKEEAKEVVEESANIETVSVQTPPATTPESTAILYIFYDEKFYIKSMPFMFNGVYVFGMEGEESVGKMTGTRYKESMRKVTIHGEGRLVISSEFSWADKPYHTELSLNISDGGVYYVKLDKENFYNFVVKKRGGLYLEQLKPKDGLKLLNKKDHFTVNPDFDYILQ